MLRRMLGVLVAAIVTVFAVLLIRGRYIQEGPVVLALSDRYGWGIHRGDILIAGAWLLSMVSLTILVRSEQTRPPRGPDPAGASAAPPLR